MEDSYVKVNIILLNLMKFRNNAFLVVLWVHTPILYKYQKKKTIVKNANEKYNN